MSDNLPELTDADRKAMDQIDMTPLLGTPEERYQVCKDYAIRIMRERNELRAVVERLQARVAGLLCERETARDVARGFWRGRTRRGSFLEAATIEEIPWLSDEPAIGVDLEDEPTAGKSPEPP